jgi:hypothetical protein
MADGGAIQQRLAVDPDTSLVGAASTIRPPIA